MNQNVFKSLNIQQIISLLSTQFISEIQDEQLVEYLCQQFFDVIQVSQLTQLINEIKDSTDIQIIQHLNENQQFDCVMVQLCYNSILSLLTNNIPIIIRPSGYVDEQFFIKYICIITHILFYKTDLQDKQLINTTLKQTVQIINAEFQQLLNHQQESHFNLIYQTTQLINKNNYIIQSSDLYIFLNFLLQSMTQNSNFAQQSQKVFKLFVKFQILSNICSKQQENLINQLMSLIKLQQNIDYITIQRNNQYLFQQQQLNIIILIHQFLELDTLKLTIDKIDVFMQIFIKYTQINFNTSALFEQLIITVFSGFQLLLFKMLQSLDNNELTIEQLVEKKTIIFDTINNILKNANFVFDQINNNSYIKSFSHQLIQYYLSFYNQMLKYSSQIQFPVVQVTNNDITEQITYDTYMNQINKQINDVENTKLISANVQVEEVQDNELYDHNLLIMNEVQRIKHIFFAIINTPIVNTRMELFQQTKLVINLDEYLPEYGQIIQQYSLTELPSSIIRLFVHIFDVEEIRPNQFIQILQHPGFQSALKILKRLIKYNNTLKQIELADQQFVFHINKVLIWFENYLETEKHEKTILEFLFSTVSILIKVLYETCENIGGNFIEMVFQNNIHMILIKLLNKHVLYEFDKEIGALSMFVIQQCVSSQSKYYIEDYILEHETIKQKANDVKEKLKMQFNEDNIKQLLQVLQLLQTTEIAAQQQQQIMIIYLFKILSDLVRIDENILNTVINNFVFINQFMQDFQNATQSAALITDEMEENQKMQLEYQQNYEIKKPQYININIVCALISLCGSIITSIYNLDQQKTQKQQDLILLLLDELFIQKIIIKMLTDTLPLKLFRGYHIEYLVHALNKLVDSLLKENLQECSVKNSKMNIINQLLFQIWTIFSYKLSLSTILYSLKNILHLLQQNKFDRVFTSQLIIQGYLGCQSRNIKYNNTLDQGKEIFSNITTCFKDGYDQETNSQYSLNQRIDQDFVRSMYIMVLSKINFHNEVIQHIIVNKQLRTYTILNTDEFKGFYYQLLELFVSENENNLPEEQMYNKFCEKILLVLQNSLQSQINSYFLLFLVKMVVDSNKLQQQQQILENIISQSETINNFWDINDIIIQNKVNREQKQLQEKLSKLYPHRQNYSQNNIEQNILFDGIQSNKIFVEHVNNHEQLHYLLYSMGLMHQQFNKIQQKTIYFIIKQYGVFQMAILFTCYINQYVKYIAKYSQNKQREQQRIIQQYEQLTNTFSILIVQQKQQRNQIFAIKNSQLKQSLLFLQLGILHNCNTFKSLFDIVIKHVVLDMKTNNYLFDNTYEIRQQRSYFNLTTLNQSNYENIMNFDEKNIEDILISYVQLQIDQVQNNSLKYIIQLTDVLGIIPFIQYILIFINKVKQNIDNMNQQEKLDIQNQLKHTLDQFYKVLTKCKYDAKRNEQSLFSELFTKELCQLHQILHSNHLIMNSFSIVVLMNTLRVTQKSTLLLNNSSIFLDSVIQNVIELWNSGNYEDQNYLIIQSFLLFLRKIVQTQQTTNQFEQQQTTATNLQQDTHVKSLEVSLKQNTFFSHILEINEENLYLEQQQQLINQHASQHIVVIPDFIQHFIMQLIDFLSKINGHIDKNYQMQLIQNLNEISSLYIIINKVVGCKGNEYVLLLTNLIYTLNDETDEDVINSLYQVIGQTLKSIQHYLKIHNQEIISQFSEYRVQLNVLIVAILEKYNPSVNNGEILLFLLFQTNNFIDTRHYPQYYDAAYIGQNSELFGQFDSDQLGQDSGKQHNLYEDKLNRLLKEFQNKKKSQTRLLEKYNMLISRNTNDFQVKIEQQQLQLKKIFQIKLKSSK